MSSRPPEDAFFCCLVVMPYERVEPIGEFLPSLLPLGCDRKLPILPHVETRLTALATAYVRDAVRNMKMRR